MAKRMTELLRKIDKTKAAKVEPTGRKVRISIERLRLLSKRAEETDRRLRACILELAGRGQPGIEIDGAKKLENGIEWSGEVVDKICAETVRSRNAV